MKTALITGGSRGIGAAMVKHFAADGFRVVFSYCHAQAQALQLSKETGAIALPCDFAQPEAIPGFYQAARQQLCHIDVLLVNHGIARSRLFDEESESDIALMLQTNLLSAMQLLRLALPDMRRQGHGSVVLTSSIWGRVGASAESAYSVSKAGLLALAQSLAREMGPSGIRVNALCPGVIQTDMLSAYTPDELDGLIAQTPLCRLGTPEDVARAAAFLASDAASFITGQALTVDGGFLTAP